MKKSKKMNYRKLSVRLTERILLIALVIVFLSGMLIHPLQRVITIKIIHKISSVVLVAGIIVHVLQHRKEKCGKEGKNDE